MTGPDTPETFRRVVEDLRTPEGARCTLIITGRGEDNPRVWLTFDGGMRTTAVLSNLRQVEAVVAALMTAPPPP